MVRFWTRLRYRAAVLTFSIIVLVAVFGTMTTNCYAAPIYDMHGLLGQTHPFLQPLPPLSEEPRQVPRVPVTRPASSGATPVGGGPMRMPQSFEQRTGEQRGKSNIKWQNRARGIGETQPEQNKSAPYKSDSFISEIRLGALLHDEGPFSSRKEDGYDANLELLFTSPDFLDILWAPRPHIGVSYNSSGDTSQAYLELTWEWDFFRRLLRWIFSRRDSARRF